jgi:DNA-binding NtrC family response regulator
VRQLENVVERAVVLSASDVLDVDDLPALQRAPTAAPAANAAPAWLDGPPRELKEALRAPEREIIEHALAHCGGTRERAAKVLGIDRSTLFHKLKKLGIQ